MAPTLTPSSATAGFFQPHPIVLPSYTSPSQIQTHPPSSPPNHPGDDPILHRILTLYLPTPTPPSITAHLHHLSRLTLSPEILTHASLAEQHPPTLHPLTTFGRPNDSPSQLQTSPSWKHLCDVQTAEGMVGHSFAASPAPGGSTQASPAQSGEEVVVVQLNPRVHAFLAAHLWDPSTASVSCPAAMTDGAAVLLREQLGAAAAAAGDDPSDLRRASPSSSSSAKKRVFEEAYARLTSLDPRKAWRAGQWMTERSGGSDVRGTETVARRVAVGEEGGLDAVGLPLGDWVVDGFKWFSSATDADCAVLLAKTEGGGGKVSCFLAPVHRRSGEGEEVVMNGVRISRLKEKLGTKALPTAELELRGMRAWLVGREGEGTKVISAVLNITRLHTAKGGMAGLGRGLAVARAWARVRPIKDQKRGKNGGEKALLSQNLQHVRWMAEETVKYRAYTSFYMFGVALLGVSELGEGAARNTKAHELGVLPHERAGALALLRLLTPVMKQACSLAAVQGIRECMESLGGVGYCENVDDGGMLNVARLLRNANVNPIWEGTASVLAEDLLRALRVGSGKAVQVLDSIVGAWLDQVLSQQRVKELFSVEVKLVASKYSGLKELLANKKEEELLWKGRVILRLFADIFCTVLLLVDAVTDEDEVSVAVARRWAVLVGKREPEDIDWTNEAVMDRRIFLGSEDRGLHQSTQVQARL